MRILYMITNTGRRVNMKTSRLISVALLMLLLCTTAALLAAGPPGEPTRGAGAQQASLPASGTQEVLRVFTGKSLVVNSPDVLKRVSVTNDQVATAIIISPNQVLIHGLVPGSVTLLLWNEQEQMRAFELQVETNLEPLREMLKQMFPKENIQVNQSGATVIMSGVVSTPEIAERAGNMAKAMAPNVLSLLTEAQMKQVILLQVKFAEVDRNALKELGVNIISTGALNTVGAITTGQFRPPSTTDVSGGGGQTSFRLTDLLNIFVFRPDLNLALTIRALQQRNLLQILAEPNLLALAGKEASFLAGGEFPVPIVQGGTGIQTISVQFKEFGVRLKFTANPQPDGEITLKVAPEVSTLDYSNAVTLSGFVIPALATRRAETEVNLRDGQSFAIAGLIDNRVTELASKVPWLGDVPFLGKLFQSKSFTKNNTELLVTVTPQIVRPLESGQLPPLPSFPVPFMDTKKFDGKAGEVPPAPAPKPPKK